ncbi:nitrate reductase, beta subunit [Denitrovibrio acetiphilus DSM 12809]|uniref:Nitrate reductase, beta subunit n=1 Tax=Denitrovibrio acetiphilus (strain DSM 12809 / NBRC 114555 / N2460) TaxID=522772 RepID=D4H1S2_DENA2|nr:nitrate reductase subunit beta [Denitrovibrio acetiphilus]ADD68832.1 nitrate reductase, beta subunit [Denitrovibrio acetiphilus DSM 12809]
MDIKAQLSMILNLDKCIGCHTCTVTCKNMWTNRKGAEYMWWNNVETKPGTGFPKKWEDQDKYKGGWDVTSDGLRLRLGGKFGMLAKIFYNPDQPKMENYYEPWTYEYEHLIDAAESKTQPTARAISQVTGKHMEIKSGPNWDDDLGGSDKYASADPNLSEEEQRLMMEFESVFMFHLPRLCNHCSNPACVASCPSGAIYKREDDGVVLIDQEKCKSWRYCVSACPYKKVYYNWNTSKSEKCIFCYPRIENGQPTICSQSCAGKIRSIGVLLVDMDRFAEVMTVADADLMEAYESCILDPNDKDVIRQAKKAGINDEWLKAASKSPAYAYIKELGLALPLHPEYRTFPSVFYVPPLSPVTAGAEAHAGLPDSDMMKIPLTLLAKLFSAGNTEPVREIQNKLTDVRKYMREKRFGGDGAEKVLKDSAFSEEQIEKAYHLITQASLNERMVIPLSSHAESKDPYKRQGEVGFGVRGKKSWRQ